MIVPSMKTQLRLTWAAVVVAFCGVVAALVVPFIQQSHVEDAELRARVAEVVRNGATKDDLNDIESRLRYVDIRLAEVAASMEANTSDLAIIKAK